MTTIIEDYVSFETAKLLKEKGFDEPTIGTYNIESKNPILIERPIRAIHCEAIITAPTLQMAMKWLREEHGIFICIGNDDLDYNWQVFDIKNRTKDLDPTCLTASYADYESYEKAVEEALKHCLEHLI